MHILKNVLSTRRTHRRTIMSLFGKQKLELHLLQQYFTLSHPTPETRAIVNPPLVQISPKHTHHTLSSFFL
jgi:hypothetical protein